MLEITCGLVLLLLQDLELIGETALLLGLGGLEIVDPQDAFKWVERAFVPNNSNLHHLLCYKLHRARPCDRGKWPPLSAWLLILGHKHTLGSKLWLRISRA